MASLYQCISRPSFFIRIGRRTPANAIRFYNKRQKKDKKRNKLKKNVEHDPPTIMPMERRVNPTRKVPSAGAIDVNKELMKMYEDRLSEAALRIKELESEVGEFVSIFNELDLQNEQDLYENGIPEVVQAGHKALVRISNQVAEDKINSPELHAFVDSMKAAILHYGGWGLAAPQIGSPIRVIIAEVEERAAIQSKIAMESKANTATFTLGSNEEIKESNEKAKKAAEEAAKLSDANLGTREEDMDLVAIVNPILEVIDATSVIRSEACLSIPGFQALVERPQKVRVTGKTPEGLPFDWVADGWHACVLQHEMDHLDGVMYVDKMVRGSFTSVESAQKEAAEDVENPENHFEKKEIHLGDLKLTKEDKKMMEEHEVEKMTQIQEQMNKQMEQLEKMKQNEGMNVNV
eukprot:GSMAST32.ASY1.ANO1.1941.1 assembled CDS